MAYEILRRSPEEASTWVYSLEKQKAEYAWIFLPIHVACFSSAPTNPVKKLVITFPQGLRMAAVGGKLPLNMVIDPNGLIFMRPFGSKTMFIDPNGLIFP